VSTVKLSSTILVRTDSPIVGVDGRSFQCRMTI
jgi:hypothetical protein